MNKQNENKIKSLLVEHLTNAVEEIARQDLVDIYYPEDYAERFSEMILQSLILIEDSIKIERDFVI